MLQLLSRLWKQKTPAARASRSRTLRQARLEVETLEGRLVPSVNTLYPAVPQSPSNSLLSSLVNSGGTLATAPLISSISLETPNERFVDHLYHDLFHTVAPQQTITTLGTELDQNQISRINVVRSFTFSRDYGLTVVQDLFNSMLHRAYNPQTDSVIANEYLTNLVYEGNAQAWIAPSSASPREVLAARIAATQEYVQTRGGGTFDGWLNALFADAVHRAPTQAERTYFSSAGISLVTAATLFHGQEHQQVVLNDFYQQFLHRPLDAAGQTYWLGRYQAGMWTEEIIAEMLESNEYFQICQG